MVPGGGTVVTNGSSRSGSIGFDREGRTAYGRRMTQQDYNVLAAILAVAIVGAWASYDRRKAARPRTPGDGPAGVGWSVGPSLAKRLGRLWGHLRASVRRLRRPAS
jgi:hypothetical protein